VKRYPKPRELKRERIHAREAKVVEEAGRHYVAGWGKVKCGVCGGEEFRVVVDLSDRVHLFCARCGVEHVVGEPPSWRDFYCVGWEE
jgi:hypothetical protein